MCGSNFSKNLNSMEQLNTGDSCALWQEAERLQDEEA
jgi:hypothetical protein